MKQVAVNVQIPKQINAWLEEQATAQLTTKATIVRQILAAHIEKVRRSSSTPLTKSLS